MRSGIARFFVSLYSTKMRGGYLRFQAQYLRKIHIPAWGSLDGKMRRRLVAVSESNDAQERNAIVAQLYRLSPAESKLIEGKGQA